VTPSTPRPLFASWPVALAALALALAPRAAPAEPAVAGIAVFPPEVNLETSRDRQSLAVQVTLEDGITRDVTAQARVAIEDPKLARFENGLWIPAADGSTSLKVEYAGKTAAVPVKVKDAAKDRPISFKLDVMPVFMKGGCNFGSCHGSARGKDGFRLSLFGFDPDGDYYRLTREIAARRINLALPAESLLLRKALGEVPHTGGKRFPRESDMYATLLRWIEAGAPPDAGEVPKLTSVEILPPSSVLDGKGETQKLTVWAHYSDGTDRDVTSLAYYLSSNDTTATVTPEGVVTAGDRGEAYITARFETRTIRTQFIVLPKGLQFTFPTVSEDNPIDKLIDQKLRKLRVAPSEVASDEVFLRRVTIDIVGLLPTAEEYQKFMTRTEPTKRALLVDELLGRKEFVELWVLKWAELLQIRSSDQVSYKAMLRYYDWLTAKIAGNVPMDQMVRELLSAKGGTFENPATNYYQNETDTLKVSENVAQVFMGMRIQCGQCHNHPFDRWTQNDYYGFAAFFSQVGRKQGEDPRETIVFNRGDGEVTHPVGGRVMAPKFLGGEEPDVKGKDRREVLAEWLASPRNPYFASNLANMVWAHFFGKGINDPVDDVRVSNPPANEELLRELGARFTEYKYDFKKLVRDIAGSRTYQLQSKTNDTNANDQRNFSHAAIRRLRAEVLLDAIDEVTETRDKFPGLPLGARAVQIADGGAETYFLTTFGRASRKTVCSCEVKMDPNLSQSLHLMNGSTVARKISKGGLIEKRLKEGKKPEEIVEELFVRCFSRKPTDLEMREIETTVYADRDREKALEDVFWSLLNSREFLFNH
jgi:uncharacterized protein DUF1549/uncharacterized protein DUF1553/Big-like domain-containing protein